MTGPAYDNITGKLEALVGERPDSIRGRWRCPVPDAHEPSDPHTLTVTNGDGKTVLRCSSGCDYTAVLAEVGLEPRDLYDANYRDSVADRPQQVVPHDSAIEAAFLGALIYRPGALAAIVDVDVDLDFFDPTHQAIARGLRALHDSGATAGDPVELGRIIRDDPTHRLDPSTIANAINDTIGAAGSSDPDRYLATLHAHRQRRQRLELALKLADTARSGPRYNVDESDAIIRQLTDTAGASDHATAKRAVAGGEFILDTPATIGACWGTANAVAWASGEPTMIVGPTGVGKTTLGGQIVRGRIGLRDQVLGLPLAVEPRRLLYVAADRPEQARRSFARMVTADDRQLLDDKLTFWRGPLPFALAKDPARLARFADQHDAGTIVIDSLKDVVAKLSDEEQANAFNNAVQECTANGVEVLVLHHQRKAQGDNKKPTSISDVYGSTWLTAGMGSVILVWGEPGDLLIELNHLKQPAEPIGPWKLLHDHEHGDTTIQGAIDLYALVRTSNGITAEAAAKAIFDRDKPRANEIEKARRQLDKLVTRGLAHAEPGGRSAIEGRQLATRYYATTKDQQQ